MEKTQRANLSSTVLFVAAIFSLGALTAQAQFDPADVVLEWAWTGSAVMPDYKQVIATPIVANLTDDNGDGRIDENDIPDIIFLATNSLSGAVRLHDGILRAISGWDGSSIFDVTDPNWHVKPAAGAVAVGDLDGDGLVEIVAAKYGENRLIIFEHDGSFKALSDTLANQDPLAAPSIADMNHDGMPEILLGSAILTGGGTLLTGTGEGYISTAVDLDLSGDLELVSTGFRAYDFSGALLFNTSAGLGFPAIGNFDDDDNPEVVVAYGGYVYLLEHDGTQKWRTVRLPGSGGGPPTVADFDGDGEAEIGVATSARYIVIETDGTVKWQQPTEDDSSQITASSVFDFNGDGKMEAVYNDEYYLRIYDGETGEVLYQQLKQCVHILHSSFSIAERCGPGASSRESPESGCLAGKPFGLLVAWRIAVNSLRSRCLVSRCSGSSARLIHSCGSRSWS